MSTERTFTGTPDDWWENAEVILESHAANRVLGDWYITLVRGIGGYRIAQPNRVPKLSLEEAHRHAMETHGYDREAPFVRRFIVGEVHLPEWVTSQYVMADHAGNRAPWVRKNNGKWGLIEDGRVSIQDAEMATRNPEPATFTTERLI